MNDFTELNAWKQARDFRNKIKDLVVRFPKDEKFRLVDQILRSSRSVTANIAEGHGRFHYQENIQYCRTARGSLTETKDHLIVALDSSFIDKNEYAKLMDDYEPTLKLLNGYISFLQKQKIVSKK